MRKYGILFVSTVGFFITIFWCLIIYVVLTESVPVHDHNVLGAIIFTVGLVLIIFHRSIGKKVYHQAMSFKLGSPDSVWIRIGESNTKRLYLVVGVITGIAGVIFFLFDTFSE